MITAYIPESRKCAMVIITNMYSDGSLGTIRYESRDRAEVRRVSVAEMEDEPKIDIARSLDEMLAMWFAIFQV